MNKQSSELKSPVCVSFSSSEILANRQFKANFHIACSPPRNLEHAEIQILSANGTVIHAGTAGSFNGVANQCEISLKAPVASGFHTWFIVLKERKERDVAHAFAFQVLPHPLCALVWGIDSAVVAGEEFSAVVALKCGCGCAMDEHSVAIRDHRGELVSQVRLTKEIWPGTDAVYFAKVPLVAPGQEGHFTWQISAVPSAAGIPHREAAAEFELQTIPAPEFTVTVRTVDLDGQTPLARATVVMHPFRTLSDANGVATLRVSKGKYRLLVSAANHGAMGHRVRVAKDCSITVKLTRAKVQNPYSDWDSTL